MRRTALALFVIKPTHLRCEKLDLIRAKSKFRPEPSVGGFAVGIAACVACEFELLDGSISYPNFCAAKDGACCFYRERGPEALGTDEFAGRLKHGP